MGFQQPSKPIAILEKESDKNAATGIHGPTLDDFIYQLFAHFRSWLMWLEVAKDVTLSVKFVFVGEVSDCQFLRIARSLLILFTAAGVFIETMTLVGCPMPIYDLP